MEKCLICHQNIEEFNKHPYRKHKILLSEYYLKYYPRVDKFTGLPIPFKDKESYFSSDFINKENMRRWYHSVPPETAREYFKSLLIKRKNEKEIIWSPSQVELRSLMMPSIITYNKLFNNYYGLCEFLGFQNRFRLFDSFNIPLVADDNRSDFFINIDSREQQNLTFDCPTQVTKLNFGDYSLSDEEISGRIFIERKSLSDFIGTFSHDKDRFVREVERAIEKDCYLIVLVEESLDNVLKFKELSHSYKKYKISPSFIMHNVRELIQSYYNLQFLFVKDRVESAKMVKKILFSKGLLKDYDCQLLYDQQIL